MTDDGRREPSTPSRIPRQIWPLITIAASLVPIAGLFTLSRVFYLRDLAMAFRPRFLFVRHAIASGAFPMWDPYPAHGQPAINDALYQLFHLPSLLIRLLPSELLAYNLWVALPVPIAAAGMYLFLRRHVGRPAAALGGFAFAASGPIASSLNFPNLSWSVCMVPLVFWSLERLFERRTAGAVTLVATLVALQALAGEPVSLFTTMLIAGAYAVFPKGRWGDWRLALLTGFALGAGVLLAAIQYIPLWAAAHNSPRATIVDNDFWTFHPLALIELVVPHFFGDYFNSNLHQLAWMVALNSGRDPFYYTMYVGVPIVLLAAVGMLSGRAGTRFWTATAIVCALASLGSHTPVLPVLQAVIPVLRSFRFPVKYLTFTGFAIATLAAIAFQSILDADAPPRAVRWTVIVASAVAAVTYVGIGWVLLAPALPIRAFYRLAVWAGVPAPIQGAEFLLYRARPLFSSLLLKLICLTFLLWVAASRRRERRVAIAVLAAFAVIDLVASNSDVNPTISPSLIEKPAWARQLPPDMHERVYVGGRPEGFVDTNDADSPKYAELLDGLTPMEIRHVIVGEFVTEPSGARLRESMSYDLPMLWPIPFTKTKSLFRISSHEARMRFLDRVGVRYAVLPRPPFPGAVPLAGMMGTTQMHLYEVNPHATRVTVVPDALMGPSIDWQIQGMFLARFNPSDGVLTTGAPPPPSGIEGLPVAPFARFVDDGLNRVVVNAGVLNEGYLALFDSYDPDWTVDVDGEPATMMRADGLFRAVHLRRGTHVVTFHYRPSRMYLGAAVSSATALVLLGWCAVSRRRRTVPATVHG